MTTTDAPTTQAATPVAPAGQAPAPPAPPPARRSGLPLPARAAIVLALLGAVVALVWYAFLRPAPVVAGVITVTGRLEGDDAAVATKLPGRIREITVREGDRVEAGQVVAVLDDEQVRSRVEQARHTAEQADARVLRARRQIGVFAQQLEQSRLGVEQSRTDARGRVDQAQSQVAAAEASLAQAVATFAQAKYDAEKFTTLAREGIEPERAAKQAQAVADAQAAAVRAARKQVDAARAALETARANLANPAIRSAGSAAIEEQIAQARDDVSAAEADAARARAAVDEAEASRKDLTIVAPFAGTVATRSAEPGEVVAAGAPIVTIVDLSKVYLRAFVPEGDIGNVKVGQRARVYLDSAPTVGIDATVARVDPEATFTPENTYFRDDRVRQVVGVKLQIERADGSAKPGMPADGEILVAGDAWPAGTRR
jgi:HlyD family secretion protein